ncbi:BZ3500_MvSof-1268-A1-R1_Chr4-4g07442 [Microbotryum saponariae]|uniref:BZ3500_MvSof-1268-A1-R1_Chr4-4g07442 protein n=1 Tax=Microbotryum saponariae TaxID=289078 RepID=A0A2X0KXG5_9BASI|nr:BZ3500_MvSof-1268-A1-R1_Chr4-4g07442 [Microbotryum saponariae]SDA07103.1 BZ3501_MvSof-1269-A2-R1_Chr4-3g07150 [Microbotryum saponariae]
MMNSNHRNPAASTEEFTTNVLITILFYELGNKPYDLLPPLSALLDQQDRELWGPKYDSDVLTGLAPLQGSEIRATLI